MAAKSAFWMSLEYAEYVEPALPASASGYEDKRLQCNPQKGQPQHSLMPGVPTSPPHPPFLSRQHKVTSANAFSILMQASRRRIIKSKILKWERSTGKTYLGLPTLSSSLYVSVSLSLRRPFSHSVSIPLPLWQTAPPAFFMFGCCRRGINLLFVAVNQISTDRFKLIASVSWSQKERVLQAPISFYSLSDILINDTCVHAHTQTHTLCSFLCSSDFFS